MHTLNEYQTKSFWERVKEDYSNRQANSFTICANSEKFRENWEWEHGERYIKNHARTFLEDHPELFGDGYQVGHWFLFLPTGCSKKYSKTEIREMFIDYMIEKFST